MRYNNQYEIYRTGVQCSQCPTGTACESETGLCVKEGAAPVTTTTTSVHPETTVGSMLDPVRNYDVQTTTAPAEVSTDAPIVCLPIVQLQKIQIYF